MEKTFEELVNDIHYDITNSFRKDDILQLLQQVREATIAEAVKINNEVVLFNMGVDLESDVEFRDSNDEILNLPTDRIKLKQ